VLFELGSTRGVVHFPLKARFRERFHQLTRNRATTDARRHSHAFMNFVRYFSKTSIKFA